MKITSFQGFHKITGPCKALFDEWLCLWSVKHTSESKFLFFFKKKKELDPYLLCYNNLEEEA